MTEEIQELSKELEKLLNRTSDDLTSTLVNLSGSLKAIVCGTHIKIPLGAGYVNYYKLQDSTEKISMWITQEIYPETTQETNYNTDEESKYH